MDLEYNKHDVAVYGGYLDDNAKILQSASGGIATALSEYMLQQDGYVVGVTYSSDFYKAEYVVIDNIADVHKLKGSKYTDYDKKNELPVSRIDDNNIRIPDLADEIGNHRKELFYEKGYVLAKDQKYRRKSTYMKQDIKKDSKVRFHMKQLLKNSQMSG